DEPVPSPEASGSGRRRRRVSKRAREIERPRAAPSGDDAREQRAHGGDHEPDDDRAPVQPVKQPGPDIARDLKLLERTDAAVAECHARDTAGDRDQGALGDQLPYQPRAAAADGETDGDLTRANWCPARQE